MTAITNEQDVCASCQAFVAPAEEPVAPNPASPPANFQPAINPFQQTAESAPLPAFPAVAPNNQYVPQPNYQNTPPPRLEDRRSAPYSAEPLLESSCVKCGAPLPRGQRACLDCGFSKKSSPIKYLVALLIIGVIGFFTFDYAYEQVSPYGTVKKYAKTTGVVDNIVYENFVLKGETSVTADASFSTKNLGTFSFKMVHKKPNVSSVEFLRGEETAFKQVYDGTRGWKYTNMPGQPVGYQDTEDGFGSKKMGLGMDNYDSLEFMDEAAREQFGPEIVDALSKIKEVEMEPLKQPSGEKTFLVGKDKRNGKTEPSLLVFDQKTGLLLAVAKNAFVNNMVLTTVIYFDNYAKFPVKRKGLFGVSEVRVLMPTKMKIATGLNTAWRAAGMPVITINMDIKSVETDTEIDAGYFTK